MSRGENLAEASLRDRGCGSAWWTRGWWRALVIEDRDLNTRQEMQEVYRLAKCRVASRVKLGNIGENGHGRFEG